MKYKFNFALLSLSLCLTVAGQVSAVEFGTVVADKSTITFSSKQMGVPAQGRFPKFTATVSFDPAKPEAAKINVIVEAASIDAGSKEANDEVVGKPWFNVRMFPTATLTSTAVKAIGGGKFELTGQLSIKGKVQPVSAPFTYKNEGANGVFDGTFTIKRLDFSIGEGPWADLGTVANDVQINFHMVAAPTAAATKK
jgi:polyisoprenoid-binding protein YceI